MFYKANTIPWKEAIRRRQEQLNEGGTKMNRIEEIKERLERCESSYVANGDVVDDARILLSKLEIAEKALERYANLHKLMYDDAINGERYEDWWIRQSKYAVVALQQLREGE